MVLLSVNVNKVALLRNARDGGEPSPVKFAEICLNAGASGVTIHPRPDLRHIIPRDVMEIAALCHARGVELNIEGNPFYSGDKVYPGLYALVKESGATSCTFVPDSTEQKTSDHGFDCIRGDVQLLRREIGRFQELGAKVSLFMDADVQQVERAVALGGDCIELFTGPFAFSFGKVEEEEEFLRLQNAAGIIVRAGLQLRAGHDLNLDNLQRVAHLQGLSEVSIGHALIIDALVYGLESTIKKYVHLL